jgi:N-methylhydantoinase A
VHECTVDIDTFEIDAKTIDRIKDAFHRRHEQLYTYSERHSLVEVVNVESTVYGLIDKPETPVLSEGKRAHEALKGRRKAIFAASGDSLSAPVYDGGALGAGAEIEGPAIIEETTTTIVIEPGWKAELHRSGSYVITRGKSEGGS